MTEVTRLRAKSEVDAIETGTVEGELIAGCALYHLDEGTRQYSGGLLYVQPRFAEKELVVVGSTDFGSGVLDLRWLWDGCIAAACSDGQVRGLKVARTESGQLKCKDVVCFPRSGRANGLALSIDCCHESDRLVAASFSKGAVQVWRTGEGDLRLAETFIADAHGGTEVWTVAAKSVSAIYSGADDGAWCSWDLRSNASRPVLTKTNAHRGVGVTATALQPSYENLLLTGGYDDTVRVWDLRSLRDPVQSAHVGVGGGVWRIKVHPSNHRIALVAAMYNGFNVVELDGDAMSVPSACKVISRYTRHDSLAYGACWIGDPHDTRYALTGSFYDCAVHLWEAIPRSHATVIPDSRRVA